MGKTTVCVFILLRNMKDFKMTQKQKSFRKQEMALLHCSVNFQKKCTITVQEFLQYVPVYSQKQLIAIKLNCKGRPKAWDE